MKTLKTMNKEQVEMYLAKEYLGAENFVWGNHNVSFDYNRHVPKESFQSIVLENEDLKKQLEHMSGVADGLLTAVVELSNVDQGDE